MIERKIVAKFAKEIREKSNIYFEVIKDSGGISHRKPFDAFACYQGRFFAFEFKIGEGKLRDHQEKALMDVAANMGKAFVARILAHEKIVFYRAHSLCVDPGYCQTYQISEDPTELFDELCLK